MHILWHQKYWNDLINYLREKEIFKVVFVFFKSNTFDTNVCFVFFCKPNQSFTSAFPALGGHPYPERLIFLSLKKKKCVKSLP